MPEPRSDEDRDTFISRCMSDSEAQSDFPRNDQRMGFCISQWDRFAGNSGRGLHTFAANLDHKARRRKHEGRSYIVAPSIMARADVAMNGAILAAEEMRPDAWNGVPVTMRHPRVNDDLVSASDDRVRNTIIGHIANAEVTADGRLRGELWIDEQRAEAAHKGITAQLMGRSHLLDVSTGYFQRPQRRDDGLIRHTDIVPDHLALLPDEPGACSQSDGCGIRANQRKGVAMQVSEAWNTLASALGFQTDGRAQTANTGDGDGGQDGGDPPTTNDGGDATDKGQQANNARGSDDDPVQIVADLISSDMSPFVPQDDDGLRMLTPDTLASLRQMVMDASGGGEGETNGSGSEGDPMSGNSANEGGQATNGQITLEQLPSDWQQAINTAKRMDAERRKQLCRQITAHTQFTEETLGKKSTDDLEELAAHVAPQPDYSGRGAPLDNNANEAKEVAEQMRASTANEFFGRSKESN